MIVHLLKMLLSIHKILVGLLPARFGRVRIEQEAGVVAPFFVHASIFDVQVVGAAGRRRLHPSSAALDPGHLPGSIPFRIALAARCSSLRKGRCSSRRSVPISILEKLSFNAIYSSVYGASP